MIRFQSFSHLARNIMNLHFKSSETFGISQTLNFIPGILKAISHANLCSSVEALYAQTLQIALKTADSIISDVIPLSLNSNRMNEPHHNLTSLQEIE